MLILDAIKPILDTWQFNVIALLVVSVVFNQFYKLAVTNIKKDGIALVILQSIGGISILALTPFWPLKFSNDPKIYGLLLVAVIFYTINDRMQTTVRKNLEVSTYSILNQLSKVFIIFYGIFVFGQDATFLKLFGGGLIFFGNAALFYRKGKFSLNKYVLMSILAALIVATGIMIDVGISSQFNLPIYIMLTLVVPSLLIFTIERHSLAEVYAEFLSERKKYYVITGIFWGLLILFTIRSLQLGEAIFIAPLMATSVLLNVIVAYFMHKEQTHFVRKLVVAMIIILGVYLTVAS